MNYAQGKVCLLGSHGFLGSAIAAEIKKGGGKIVTTPEKDCLAVLHFASPTHLPFEKNPAYHTQEIINSFLYLLPFCEQNNIPFIFPSSALVYEGERPFANLKLALEWLTRIYKVRTVALRIFPVYGVGEERRDNKTFIYQSVQRMFNGNRALVYGDGTQSRDFVYISDVVDTVIKCIFDEKTSGIKDVGTGIRTSFNEIIQIINEELGTELKPEYVSVPKGYTEGVVSTDPIIAEVDIREGIRRIIKSL